MKKVILYFLTLFLLVSCIGCGCTDEPEESTTEITTKSVNTTSEIVTTNTDLSRYILTLNAGVRDAGLYYDNPSAAGEQEIMEVWETLMEAYEFTIETVTMGDYDDFRAACAAGQKAADILSFSAWYICRSVLSGYLMRLDIEEVRATGLNVMDSQMVDLYYTEATKLDNKVFSLKFTNSNRPVGVGYVCIFNKKLAADAGYPAEVIYQSVRDGVWTWDVFADICKAAAIYDKENCVYEVWGCDVTNSSAMLQSMGEPIIRYERGKYVSGINRLSFVSAYNKMLSMLGDSDIYHRYDYGDLGSAAYSSRFLNGETVFIIKTYTRNETVLNFPTTETCNFEFGIVPLPIGGSASGYMTDTEPSGTCIQAVNADWEKVCFLLAEFSKLYNDSEAGLEVLRNLLCDAESYEMIREYVLPNQVCAGLLQASEENMRSIASAFISSAKTEYNEIQNIISAAMEYSEQFSAAVDEVFKGFNK